MANPLEADNLCFYTTIVTEGNGTGKFISIILNSICIYVYKDTRALRESI